MMGGFSARVQALQGSLPGRGTAVGSVKPCNARLSEAVLAKSRYRTAGTDGQLLQLS